MICGRFAPSPSGRMHLGNVYTALISYLSAKKDNGAWFLRIEDLDKQRCKKEYADALMDDLLYLGLRWDGEIVFQSKRADFYQSAFNSLEKKGLVYNCYCTRADCLKADKMASSAPHSINKSGGCSRRCFFLSLKEKQTLSLFRTPSKRIHVDTSLDEAKKSESFMDKNYGLCECNIGKDCGDFIICRSDKNYAYQLAVTVDDALMGITEVVRGRDLIPSTYEQLYLYHILNFTPPIFFHIPLLLSLSGRRLSKRDKDLDMGILRSRYSKEDIIGYILFLSGITDVLTRMSLEEALSIFDYKKIKKNDIIVSSPFLN